MGLRGPSQHPVFDILGKSCRVYTFLRYKKNHKVVCRGTKSFLEEDPEIEVVGLASDGHSAVRLVQELQPQVVLVDINMPGLNGIETTWP